MVSSSTNKSTALFFIIQTSRQTSPIYQIFSFYAFMWELNRALILFFSHQPLKWYDYLYRHCDQHIAYMLLYLQISVGTTNTNRDSHWNQWRVWSVTQTYHLNGPELWSVSSKINYSNNTPCGVKRMWVDLCQHIYFVHTTTAIKLTINSSSPYPAHPFSAQPTSAGITITRRA